MLSIESLREFGANVDEGLSRCMGKEDFYLRMVKMALSPDGYNALKAAIEANDLNAAFEAAHSLKGVLANLALTPILKPASEITELLRARTEMDYSALLTEVLTQYEKLVALAAE